MIEAMTKFNIPAPSPPVPTPAKEAPTLSNGLRLAHAMEGLGRSGLRDVMELLARPGILSLAVGLPASELFPHELIAQGIGRRLANDPKNLQYTLPLRDLKARIAELMVLRGVSCRPEQIFLTSGCQQAMDLHAHLLLDPKGQVMMESSIYDGIRMVALRFDPQILTVPSDPETGIDVDAVASWLERGARPAFLYVITEGHNPLGVSISLEKRLRLVELARQYRMPILEDDTYGFLRYDGGPSLPSLHALDPEWVCYMGSFSKTIAPALRTGWTIAPEPLLQRLSVLKHASDIDAPSIGHHAVHAFLESGHFPRHLETLRTEYGRRRDAMLAALEQHMPAGVRWNRPTGGFFVWMELPRHLDAADLLRVAVETEQVAFVPGSALCAVGGSHARNCLRLCFTSCSAETIEEGVRRLGRVIKGVMAPI
jgi:2-aminoadipate transaminase